MSIYKPNLLDKFKDFVNGLKSNWDAYEGHVEDFETAKGIITDAFNQTRTYAVGDYAIYENVLYKCVEAIEEAGEWDADKWAATNIAEEFKSHQAEKASDDVHELLSGGKIIEASGGTGNGYYIRFADGTQICWRNTDIDPLSSGTHSLYWQLPRPMIDNRYYFDLKLGVGNHGESAKIEYIVPNSSSTNTEARAFIKLTSNLLYTTQIRWYAVGRWK